MNTKSKIFLLTASVIFLACNSKTNYKKGVSILRGFYKIDTNTIITNRNLPPLIEELEKNSLTEFETTKKIPLFIKTFVGSLIDTFFIADPGEPWRSGCTPPFEIDYENPKKYYDKRTKRISYSYSFKDKEYPIRQLVYFGLGKDIALMTYYTGGIGMIGRILIFKFKGTEITDFWCGNESKSVNNKKEILLYLKNPRQYTNLMFAF
jgi:hypothetical protein